MAKYYNLARRDFSYQVGDMVWYRVHAPKSRFAAKWKGPYVIIKMETDLNYILRELGTRELYSNLLFVQMVYDNDLSRVLMCAIT
jgi:hypothetical protein